MPGTTTTVTIAVGEDMFAALASGTLGGAPKENLVRVKPAVEAVEDDTRW